jgi:RimJ/RimL family protein N-acetyltransferase
MIDISYRDEKLSFVNICKDDLTEVLNWYNSIQDYMYGTGIDKPITSKEIKDRFIETAISTHDFFAWIASSEYIRVGIIKGSVKSQDNEAIWINSLLIRSEYRRKGYGRNAVNKLIDYIERFHNIKRAFVSVVEDNKGGLDFWSKLGFKKTKHLDKHVTLAGVQRDVIIMCKQL